MSSARAPQFVEYASLRRRLASLLYESLLLIGVLFAGFFLPWILVGLAFHYAPPGWVEWLHILLLLGVYFVVLWRRNGQTLAMQTWQLQLIDPRTGLPPSRGRCIARYLLAWPGLLLTLSGPGIAWAAWLDRDRQFVHDRLAGTAIVFNPRRPQEVS